MMSVFEGIEDIKYLKDIFEALQKKSFGVPNHLKSHPKSHAHNPSTTSNQTDTSWL